MGKRHIDFVDIGEAILAGHWGKQYETMRDAEEATLTDQAGRTPMCLLMVIAKTLKKIEDHLCVMSRPERKAETARDDIWTAQRMRFLGTLRVFISKHATDDLTDRARHRLYNTLCEQGNLNLPEVIAGEKTKMQKSYAKWREAHLLNGKK